MILAVLLAAGGCMRRGFSHAADLGLLDSRVDISGDGVGPDADARPSDRGALEVSTPVEASSPDLASDVPVGHDLWPDLPRHDLPRPDLPRPDLPLPDQLPAADLAPKPDQTPATLLEIDLNFEGNSVGGIRDRNGVSTGFATLMNAPKAVCGDSVPTCDDPKFPYNPSRSPYYIPGNLFVSTLAGTLAVTTTDGDNVLTLDDQDNALAVTFDASKPFQLHIRIVATASGDTPDQDFEGGGVFWGTDASNYVKLVFAHNCDDIVSPCLGIQFASELGGVWSGGSKAMNVVLAKQPPFGKWLDLKLAGDLTSGLATASYSIDGGPAVLLGTRAVPAALFTKTAFAGLATTNTPYSPPSGGTPFTMTFDFFRLLRP